tara:strand:- start:4237 stop:4842 length:606 start_codon:yes stop_codon:yes gene_type:complete
MNIQLPKLINVLEQKQYAVFKGDSKPFNLNIVGIRAMKPISNKFNDTLCVFWCHEGNWSKLDFCITTLPGLVWLERPMNPKGCAILVPGQYRSVYKIDLHSGKYPALCQRNGNVTVYRDNDKDRDWDMIEGSEETGKFGINIHRASAYKEVESVNSYSAGCQVFQNPDEFGFFMNLCERSREQWGDTFTYTLITQEDYYNG